MSFHEPPICASYIILKERIDTTDYYYAINGKTGETEFGGLGNVGGVNGTIASDVIQSAIDSLTNGGKISIRAGTYLIDSTIKIKDWITLEGEGFSEGTQEKKTVLKGSSSLTSEMIGYSPAATGWGVRSVRIANLKLLQGDGSGCAIKLGAYLSIFEKLYIRDFKDYALHILGAKDGLTAYRAENHFSHIFMHSNPGGAIFMKTFDSFFDHIDEYNNGSTLVPANKLLAGQNQFINSWFDNPNAKNNLFIRGSESSFLNCRIVGSKEDMIVFEIESGDWVYRLQFISNRIQVKGLQSHDLYGVLKVTSVDGGGRFTMNIFKGNTLKLVSGETNKPKYVFDFINDYSNQIKANHIESELAGTRILNWDNVDGLSQIKGNIGFVTENSGTASGSSPITIPQTTHLLDVDPTYVNAVSKTSGYSVISVRFDSVTKDIVIEHSGGATSIDVFWEAKV